jgi:hypothetical protein
VKIDIDNREIFWGKITFALITSFFGISIYYFLPLSLLSFDFGLLIAIFFWILISLLSGFILMSLNIQHFLEKIIVYLVLCYIGSDLKSLVLKNLAAHRLKNRRTAIMFSLSVAFVIFVWTAMSV